MCVTILGGVGGGVWRGFVIHLCVAVRPLYCSVSLTQWEMHISKEGYNSVETASCRHILLSNAAVIPMHSFNTVHSDLFAVNGACLKLAINISKSR